MPSIGLVLELVNSYVDKSVSEYYAQGGLKLGAMARGPTPTLARFDLSVALGSGTSLPVTEGPWPRDGEEREDSWLPVARINLNPT